MVTTPVMNTFLRRIPAAVALLSALGAATVSFAAPPQSVSITAPPSGAQIGVAPGSPVTITSTASASAGNQTISSIDFRVNGTSIGSVVGGASSVTLSTSWQPTAVGTYTLTAVASDSSSGTGNTLTSNPATVTVTSVTASATSYQFISVTAPASNTTFAQNSTAYVRANATMTAGLVSSVEFFLTSNAPGSTPQSLGTSTIAPYNRVMTLSGAPGGYTLTARATGSGGESFDSAAVPITIASSVGSGPTVSISTPLNTDVIAASSNVTLGATATDTDGNIVSVSFFADGEQVGATDTTAPYSVTWTPVLVKSYVLTALAVDNNANARLSDPVSVTVRASAPTVSISAPVAGANLNVGVPATVTAAVTPTAGTTINNVEFFANGASIGTDNAAPYTLQWTPQNAGATTLTARATDSNMVSVLSAGVSVNVGTTSLPTVAITAPTIGQIFPTGATVNIAATATPATGLTIASVTFSVDGATIGSDTSSPYSASWPATAGAHVITAIAVDSVGGSASTQVNITVGGTSTAPTVTLAPNGTLSMPSGSTRVITATATPATGIERVEFILDGSVIATDSAPPYSFLFTAPELMGARSLTARAVDSAGNSGTSAALTVNVTGATGSPPLIAIATPSSNVFLAPVTATTISGTVSDGDGNLTGVQVFVNGTALTGTATLSGGNWTMAWTTPAAPGVATITAIASDGSGNAIAAPEVTVNIADTSSPGITLTLSPVAAGQTASTTFPSGAVRNFVASLTPAAGRAVVRVEFFIDGTKIGEDTTAPYTFRYAAPQLGDGEQSRVHIFSARATDNAGAARDVQLPLLIVSPIGLPPTVRLLTPASGASVVPGSAVSLAATATGNGGPITSVQFYVNGNPAGVFTGTSATPTNTGFAIVTPPYTATFIPTAPGSYTIDAIATDDRGNTSVSNSATITAAFTTPTVVFTSPNPNALARATPNVPINLTATATVQSGTGASVLLVEFLLDGVQIGADTTVGPNNTFSISWLPTAAQLGQHVLTARVTDTNSQTAVSPPLNINVANIIGSPPTVSVLASPIPVPFGIQTVSTVNFVATAVATGGSTLSNVEIFLNDISIGLATREQNTNLYRIAFDMNRFDFTSLTPTINELTGAVTYPVRLYAIARDSNNNQTVSATTNLTINPATSTPPSIQLISGPATNITAGSQFFMGAIFNDLDGVVTSIQLFANGSPVGGALANPQQGQTLTYNATNAGRFNLYAVATDDTGNTAVSSPSIVLTVTAVNAPTTTITRPTDNTTIATALSPVFLEGTAVNTSNLQVPTLQFVATGATGSRQVINGIRVGTTTTYRAIWTPINPDTYTVTTQAAVGQVTGTSTASRQVRVTEVLGLAPSITLTRAPGQAGVPGTATTASTADFAATATDPDGSIVEVEFFLNRVSVGLAQKDPQGNTWRVTASFAGLQPGLAEVVALVKDSSNNIAASPTSFVNVVAASSIAPSITITPSTLNPAFNRAVQLRANARDSDGNINSVQYFANGIAIPNGTSTNAGSLFLTSWTPTVSGTYYLYAVATDNSGITRVSDRVEVNVRRNNPVLENAAFILQTYQDIANTTNINPLVFDELDEQLASGALTRADIIVSDLTANGGVALTELAGFQAPVNLLAAYYVLMGQWPTPANYTTFLATARNNGLANAVNGILFANEYFAKYGFVPTTQLLDNPNSAVTAEAFLNRLHLSAGIRPPEPLDRVSFRSNNVLSATRGRGYNVVGLPQAIAEFVTNTNSTNTALFAKARAAALFYQLTRPPVTVTVDEITARIDALLKLPSNTAIADAVLKDVLYGYRYVTITKHPQSLVVAARSGVIMSVEAQGAPPLVYQWLLNGAPIPGATNTTLSLTNVDATRVGTYTVAITSNAATATSDRATLTLSTVPTKLANISTRGVTTGGANVLIGGFVVVGANQQQTRQMLIRVIGPTLGAAPFNVAGVLANPRLEVYSGNAPNPVLTNEDWGTQAGGAAQVTAIQQASQRVAAFALPNNSLDAVVLATLPPGPYTVQAKGPANNPNASGVVLIEVYDVTPNAATPGRAANVSTRGSVGTGTNILIAGFVVNGGVSRRVLVRGAGPTLANLGVPGVLADPQLTLIDQATGRTLATNDNWASGEDAGIIANAASAAGAFPFASGSRDSAIIIMLPPGAYTAQLSGVGGGTGVGIVEVYDVDP